MIFRVVVILLVLAGVYASFEIGRFALMFHTLRSTEAAFVIKDKDPDTPSLILVEFLDYGCEVCRPVHKAVKDFLEIRPDIKYIARPIVVQEEGSENLARIALAAGLQGNFWALHDAFIGHEGKIDDRFVRETAGLYGLDYDRLVKESESEEIKEILEDNKKDALDYGIYSVPTLLLGKTFINNFQKSADGGRFYPRCK